MSDVLSTAATTIGKTERQTEEELYRSALSVVKQLYKKLGKMRCPFGCDEAHATDYHHKPYQGVR